MATHYLTIIPYLLLGPDSLLYLRRRLVWLAPHPQLLLIPFLWTHRKFPSFFRVHSETKLQSVCTPGPAGQPSIETLHPMSKASLFNTYLKKGGGGEGHLPLVYSNVVLLGIYHTQPPLLTRQLPCARTTAGCTWSPYHSHFTPNSLPSAVCTHSFLA